MSSEQSIQTKILNWLEKEGYYARKFYRAKSGTPDIVACIDGKFLAIEVKRPETKTSVSKLQAANLMLIERAGGEAMVAWTLEMVIEKVEEMVA